MSTFFLDEDDERAEGLGALGMSEFFSSYSRALTMVSISSIV